LIWSQTNTWSNQRRKRRQLQHDKKNSDEISVENSSAIDDYESSTTTTNVSWKRKDRDEDEEEYFELLDDQHDDNEPLMKRLREEVNKPVASTGNSKDDIKYLLSASITLKREGKGISLRMQTQNSSLNPETTYQLFQYFKNKLTK
jgi:hypothetical protein